MGSGSHVLMQLGLWDSLAGESLTQGRSGFDPRAFTVRRIRGVGAAATVAEFLDRWHYSRSEGMPGPRWGLYHSATAELVGVACFGRHPNPWWGRLTFRARVADFDRLRRGEWNELALAFRTVAESEYLDLNRLALAAPTSTSAPLGTGAASWFVARCLAALVARNRALWIAHSRVALGMRLPPDLPQLLSEASAPTRNRGLGYVKVVTAFADPAHNHTGRIYQALGMRYGGTSGIRGREQQHIGLRSGATLSRRTIQKARKSSTKGYPTAALRLAWEGDHTEIRILHADGTLLASDDAAWVREIPPAPAPVLRSALRARWRQYRAAAQVRHGRGCRIEVHVRRGTGGTRSRTCAGKYRYVKPLGVPYWAAEVLARCKYPLDQPPP